MEQLTKALAASRLGNVPEDKQFWSNDGQSFKNLLELKEGLQKMTDETFRYHVNESKNDFSTWVMDVISDEKLAGDLKKSATRIQSAKSVADRINFLRKKAT
jgi:hypothetical protein